MIGLTLYAIGLAALVVLAALHAANERRKYRARFMHLWRDTDAGL